MSSLTGGASNFGLSNFGLQNAISNTGSTGVTGAAASGLSAGGAAGLGNYGWMQKTGAGGGAQFQLGGGVLGADGGATCK